MNTKQSRPAMYVTVLLLIILGIFMMYQGSSGTGTGLIAGAVGVFTVKSIQHKRIDEMESEGKVAYDERSLYLSSKAALAAIRTYILVMALLVLLGSAFGSNLSVTPWDLMGFMLAFIVFLWIGFYYYYNRVE